MKQKNRQKNRAKSTLRFGGKNKQRNKHGVPKIVRTDRGLVFLKWGTSRSSEGFCNKIISREPDKKIGFKFMKA